MLIELMLKKVFQVDLYHFTLFLLFLLFFFNFYFTIIDILVIIMRMELELEIYINYLVFMYWLILLELEDSINILYCFFFLSILYYVISFDLVQTMITISTGVGLLSIAVVLTDFILQHVHNKKDMFENHKYEYLDYNGNESENKKNNRKNLIQDDDDGFI